jgi:hypothetical protein
MRSFFCLLLPLLLFTAAEAKSALQFKVIKTKFGPIELGYQIPAGYKGQPLKVC